MLQILSMLQRQFNKYSGTKQEASARKVEASRYHDRRDDHGGFRQSRSIKVHHHRHHSQGHSTRRTHAHSRSENWPKCVPCQTSEEEIWIRYIARRELEKIKPPSLDGENRKGEYVETWMLGMRKYFQSHDYSSNVESKIAFYHIQGRASMWWDQLKQVKYIDEKIISWKQFKKYFLQ
jgi:hypothetical protein